MPCVVCGSRSDIVCDHKNDLYNDERVLSGATQDLSDFQPLCNHCNLQKRQVCKKEREDNAIYSVKNIPQFQIYDLDFPWEKKNFDISCPNTKTDTYWYDPVEFMRKTQRYIKYTLPILEAIKKEVPRVP